MNHALLLNVLIIGAVLAALLIANQPLALLALSFLREMPYGLLAAQMEQGGEDDDDGFPDKPVGFTADVR